jgi:hypothetical protein
MGMAIRCSDSNKCVNAAELVVTDSIFGDGTPGRLHRAQAHRSQGTSKTRSRHWEITRPTGHRAAVRAKNTRLTYE